MVSKKDYSEQHKKAWEFDAYNFWVRTSGTPAERAAKDKENPKKMLTCAPVKLYQGSGINR